MKQMQAKLRLCMLLRNVIATVIQQAKDRQGQSHRKHIDVSALK